MFARNTHGRRAARLRACPDLLPLESRRLLAVSATPAFVPGQVIVQFRSTVTDHLPASMREQLDVLSAYTLDTQTGVGPGTTQLLTVGSRFTTEQAIAQLRNNPDVLYAEPNWILKAADTANDPYYTNGSQWGMYGDLTTPKNIYGSQAGEAWAAGATGSSTVYVGIIDEGVMTTHSDLAANIWNNPYDPPDGIDNDGNGYTDDANGWDFYNNDRTVYDGTQDDHATHVAGIIGARGGNASGVAGVNWNVKLISAKFLGPNGGTTAAAIKAIDYITDLKVRHGLNIVATNNSWSGGGRSQALLDAITRAAQADILFVAAAGNGGADGIGDNNDALYSYPANYDTTAGAGYDSVISVAALASNGTLARYSNYGAKTVDIAAPGSSVYSTVPGSGNTSSYAYMSGTSMATPFVTGAIALYKSLYPNATAAQVRQAVLATAAPTTAVTGKVQSNGRLDIGALINYTPGGGGFIKGRSFTATDNRQTRSKVRTPNLIFAGVENPVPVAMTVRGKASKRALHAGN